MEIWTVSEVAEFLKVNPVTVYKLIRCDGLPAFRVGNEWRFVREDIEEWVKSKVRGKKGGEENMSARTISFVVGGKP